MGEETGTTGGMTMPEKMDKMLELLESSKKIKDKGIKLPKLSGGKLKKNFVLALILRTNKEAEFRKIQIKDNTIFLKDNQTNHLTVPDCVLNLKTRKLGKRYPFIILPEWDLQPISIDELQNKAITTQRLALPQKIIINAMKNAQIEKKKGMKGILIIIGLIAGAAIIYFIINSLMKKKA
jgi:hypothetical protein